MNILYPYITTNTTIFKIFTILFFISRQANIPQSQTEEPEREIQKTNIEMHNSSDYLESNENDEGKLHLEPTNANPNNAYPETSFRKIE